MYLRCFSLLFLFFFFVYGWVFWSSAATVASVKEEEEEERKKNLKYCTYVSHFYVSVRVKSTTNYSYRQSYIR